MARVTQMAKINNKWSSDFTRTQENHYCKYAGPKKNLKVGGNDVRKQVIPPIWHSDDPIALGVRV
jgi:hypothetical protein